MPTTAKRCPSGASVFPLILRQYPLGWVRLMTCGSGPRDFCLRRQVSLRRMLLASKVCPCMSQHLCYLSLTEVGTSVFCSPGSRRYRITYKKASALEQKTTSQLNALIESLSSWIAAIYGPSSDTQIDVVHPKELGELKCAWEKRRDFLCLALDTLTSEPVHHRRSSLDFMHCRSALRRWVTSLVCFS